MNHVDAEHLRDKAMCLYWKLDQKYDRAFAESDLAKAALYSDASKRAFQLFMRMDALVRRLQTIEIGDLR